MSAGVLHPPLPSDGQLAIPEQVGPLVPLSAAEWAAFGLPVPSHVWQFDASPGSTVGSTSFAGMSLPGGAVVGYQQTITGWTRTIVSIQSHAGSDPTAPGSGTRSRS